MFIFIIEKMILRILCLKTDMAVNPVRASLEYTSPNDCPLGLLGHPEKQNSRKHLQRGTRKRRESQDLARMVMEAGKPHSLPCVGWRMRKAGDLIPPDSGGLGIWEQR